MAAYTDGSHEHNDKVAAKLTHVQSAINAFDRLRFPVETRMAVREVQDLKEQLVKTQNQLDLAEGLISRLEKENALLHAQITQASVTRGQDARSNAEQEKKLQDLEIRHAQMQQLLEQRTTELNDAQAYSNKRDEHPGSVVLAKVEAINCEIFNAGTSFTQLLEGNPKSTSEEVSANQEFFDNCKNIAEGCLGSRLYQYTCQIDETALQLREPITPDNPLPLQLALQSVLVGWCIHVGRAIGMGQGEEELRRIYDEIRYREEQPVSARWRVIAASATRDHERSSVDIVKNGIMAILIIHGLSTIGDGYHNVIQRVRGRIRLLEKMLFDLKRIVHEGIVSGDFEMFDGEIGDDYSSETMIDAYPDGKVGPETTDLGSRARDEVLCTVALGLRKTVIKRGDDRRLELHTDLIKRPGVALLKILDEFKIPGHDDYM